MKTHIIRLESHDDATSIRDKMAWSKSTRILLAFPKRRPPRLSLIDLNLIQRQAVQLGGQVALVTKERELNGDARDLGIPVFSSIAEAQRMPWTLPHRRRWVMPQMNRKIDLFKQRDNQWFAQGLALPKWAQITAFLMGLAGFFALILFLIPSATIRITPQRIEQTLTLKFWANPNVPVAMAGGGMPARLQNVVVEGTLEGIGSQITAIGHKSAQGRLLLTNMTESEVEVSAGTVFQTTSEPVVQFTTHQDARVPAGVGKTVEVEVQALVSGESGNVPAGAIQAAEGPLGLFIVVANPEPTTGGSDREAWAASEQDYVQLYDALLTRLTSEALENIESTAAEPLMLAPSSLKITKVLQDERTPDVGQPADSIRINLRLEFSVLGVAIHDIETAAHLALDASLPNGYQPISTGVDMINLGEPILDAGGTIRWQGKIARTIEMAWNPEDILPEIAGLTIEQASAKINSQLDLLDHPEISVSPSWWGRLPYVSFRMTMVEK